MRKINRDKFFAGVRSGFGSLSQDQVTALNSLLDAIEADAEMSDIRWVAYALATVRHETANTYRPIEEYGKGHGKPYGHKDSDTGQAYYGRGLVQLTHRENYKKLGDLLEIDLVHHPELALEIDTAYQILSLGMRNGLFAKGQTLSRYIHDDVCDYLHARRIINAMDKAELIAGYATTFEGILGDSQQAEPEPAPTETTATSSSTVIEKTTSVVSSLAGNQQVKDIASQVVGKLATRGSTVAGSAGVAAATDGAISRNFWLIILAIVLMLIAAGFWGYLLWHRSQKERLAAQINSDPSKADIRFVK